MRMLSGYLEPSDGSILIDGVNPAGDSRAVQQHLGYLPENLPIYPQMMVADHLDYVATLKGIPEDIAMLMAFERGAELIVAVGTHNSMVEFLDKGRAGMASTFLVRMKVGPILVDAKGVNRLYDSRVRKRDLLFLVLAAVFTMVVITIMSDPVRLVLRGFLLSFK